ncbi:hypothetical protein QVD17_37041 [Tagetes erecta]|uniref:PGG domain-containing protein n=1 Tax=Tagetes erecta TaxID=13708 RepID=A0AAD8JVU0_TARER|nr:hypothetical protein QVD17_37041 [Tagetes erecta]
MCLFEYVICEVIVRAIYIMKFFMYEYVLLLLRCSFRWCDALRHSDPTSTPSKNLNSAATRLSSQTKLYLETKAAEMTKQTGVQLASIDEQKPLSQQQQQQINIPVASQPPQLSRSDLMTGPREDYLKIGVPLYEASIKCDWKAAKAVFDKYAQMELVRCSITENGETALHVAASAKGPKHVEEFVKNLVDMMTNDDLALQNNNHNTALYLAVAAGNIKAVKIMAERNRALLTMVGSNGTMMPLYTAALFGNVDTVKYLYNNSNKLCDDGWTTQNRGWLLLKCVENDMFDVAVEIVKTYPELGTGTVLGVLARKPEAFPEKKINIISRTVNWGKGFCSKMFITHQPSQNEFREVGSNKNEPFPEIKTNIFKSVSAFIGLKGGSHEKEDHAMQLLRIIWGNIAKKSKKEIDDIIRGPVEVKQDDKPNSGIVNKTLKLQKLISERIVNMHVEIQNIIRGLPVTGKEDQALQLQKLISDHIAKMHVETQNLINGATTTLNYSNVVLSGNTMKTHPSRILFVAAEMGNVTFVVELIRQYPDLIWKVNDDNQSIFHIAVKHRNEGIYNLLYEIGSMKDLITPLKDGKDNNMLHLVGKIAKQQRLEGVSGVALQMQRELLWFKEVEAMIPPSYRERKNKDGLTPYELFTNEHKDLVTQGERWMKGTASQCMVVAALIATIVFAAAFTVPGGYSQTNDKDNGIPVFHSKATFMVFVVTDAISLFASSTSILMFLSILTSRYAERDFLESLPTKLMLGLATLFLSITTMTVAFSVSFFVLYNKGLLWMPIIISVFAVLPVLLYMMLQYGLFFDVIQSTYGSRYLFKPQKHLLYYRNPMV